MRAAFDLPSGAFCFFYACSRPRVCNTLRHRRSVPFRFRVRATQVFMSSKITVIFFIVLCLEAGIVLLVLPWWTPFAIGDWSDNYFLLAAARATGLQGIRSAMSSGWVRGAVSGLGVINLLMAIWEIINFRRTVRALDGEFAPRRER